MTNRPKEIQQLIDWLREPGRELARSNWVSEGNFCTLGKLYEIVGALKDDGSVNYELSDAADQRLGLSARVWNKAMTINDDTGNPLAVADYLEQQFPVGGS